MTIELNGSTFGLYDGICDECDYSVEISADDFAEAVEFLENENWIKFQNSDSEWVNFCCKECADSYKKKELFRK